MSTSTNIVSFIPPAQAAVRLVPRSSPRTGAPMMTPHQRRQRELAWLLYITEGSIANYRHALAVNCVTFNSHDEAVVHDSLRQLERAARQIRNRLSNIR